MIIMTNDKDIELMVFMTNKIIQWKQLMNQ